MQIPDAQAILDYQELLELPQLTGVIYLASVVKEVGPYHTPHFLNPVLFTPNIDQRSHLCMFNSKSTESTDKTSLVGYKTCVSALLLLSVRDLAPAILSHHFTLATLRSTSASHVSNCFSCSYQVLQKANQRKYTRLK
jgi:hypothetical protein